MTSLKSRLLTTKVDGSGDDNTGMSAQIAAIRIARELRETEAKLDDALFASAKLLQTMLTARRNPEVEVHTGQAALMRLVRAQQNIVDGSSDIFRVHDEMLRVNREMAIMDEDDITNPSGLSEERVAHAA